MEYLISFIKFATFGVTSEIVFTAIADNVNRKKAGEKWQWRLMGHSYIWMIPIYGSIAFFAPLLFDPMKDVFILFRLFAYSIIILIVEYITGWIIQKISGRCPWHYETGWHLHGLIRFDYIPFWMFFSFLIEFLYKYY
jgi:uncharacterized membrane protein